MGQFEQVVIRGAKSGEAPEEDGVGKGNGSTERVFDGHSDSFNGGLR